MQIFLALNNRIQITRLCVSRGGAAFVFALLFDMGAQILQIASIFVPLKVIYLLGSQKVPSYLEIVYPGGTLAFWVWLLTGLTIALFVVTAMLSMVGSRLATRAGNRYIRAIKADKRLLDPKAERRLSQVFLSNFRLTNDFVIGTSFLCLTPVIDTGFFLAILFILGGCLVWLGSVAALSQRSPFFRDLWHRRFDKLVEYTFLLGFVAFFLTLVGSSLSGYHLGFLSSLVLLILTRRSFQMIDRGSRRHRVVMRKDSVHLLLE